MAKNIIHVGTGFWNLRGTFRLFGIINVGTQASLVKLRSGSFIFLDSYALTKNQLAHVRKLTNNGKAVEAILNLHPFHTVHCTQMHEDFPNAKLYGTDRHVKLAPELPWEKVRVDNPSLHKIYSNDLEFSVPRGVDFISKNERVHFSSVLAYHKASKTIHVDDTFMYLKLPFLLRLFGNKARLSLHPTLTQALEKRAGAANEFRQWCEELASNWSDAQAVCAAHTAPLLGKRKSTSIVETQILDALARVSAKLDDHQDKHG